MTDKNEAIAESIIHPRIVALTQAIHSRNWSDFEKARGGLKEDIIRELDLAEGRGANP